MGSIFTEAERRTIAGRARTLHERLAGPPNSRGTPPPIDSSEIIDEWKDLFLDEQSFSARLEREDLTEEIVREQIEATKWPEQEPLPAWIETVTGLIQHIEARTPDSDNGDSVCVSVPDDTVFPEILREMVRYACEQLPPDSVQLEAIGPLTEWLVTRLESVCLRPLYIEFKSFVEYHDPDLLTTAPEEVSELPTTYYERFIASMFEQGFKNLCREYPVLARYLVRVIDHWADAVVTVSRRLQTDRSDLREQFDISGAITTFEPLARDTHAGGQIPIRITFESGAVIYKPRPVESGVALYTILGRLNKRLDLPSFRIPAYISRDQYGWMEPIEYRDLPDSSAVGRYYERAGALLCVAYALNFIDGQLENLIVSGADPVLVDSETVFHPHIDPRLSVARTESAHLIERSLLSTGLVPWSFGEPEEADETSWAGATAGFGAESGLSRITYLSQPTITAANTDVMTVERDEVRIGSHTNTPTVNGCDQPPHDNVDALIRGFTEAYTTIVTLHADGQFFSEIAPPELVEEIENRLVYRPTKRYHSILRSTVGHNPLRDGARTSVVFEQLIASFFHDEVDTNPPWSLYQAERRALRRRDVPRIGSRADQRTVSHDGEKLDFTADMSGYERCRTRLDAMDATDRHRQTWLLRKIFGTGEDGTPAPKEDEPNEMGFRETAAVLFEDVIDAQIDTGDGNGWALLSSTHSDLNVFPADYSLYWGRGGIALTATALYTTTGNERYRRFAEKTLAPIVEDCRSGTLDTGLGGTRGVGSIVYVLSVVAALFDDDAYRERALEAACTVSTEQIANDDTYDIMNGAAGTLLGLLAYHRRYDDPRVLNRAIACGDRLLDARISHNGHQIWDTAENGSYFTGFSHGSSGIAYALGRLAAMTGESRYLAAVKETLAFESAVYSDTIANWPRTVQEDTYVDRWCHGRSGMALARIGIAQQLGDETLLKRADTVLAESGTTMSTADNVCCGNFGRVEALLVGARRGNIDLTEATQLAKRSLARREHHGALVLPGHSRWFVNPTFFDGVSGVAYTLLRLHDPDALPSVLLLE